MFNGVNKVIIIGYLGSNPNIKYLPNGNSVININIGTPSSYKDRNTGTFLSKTEWHKVVLYNNQSIYDFLKKGSKVYIEGSLKTSKFVSKDNIVKYLTEIIANNIEIIDFEKKNISYKSDDYINNDLKGNDDISF